MSWGHEDDLNHTGYPLEQRFVLFINGHWWFLMRLQFRVRKMSCGCLKLLYKLGFNSIHSKHYFVAQIRLRCQRVRNQFRYFFGPSSFQVLTPTVLRCLWLNYCSFFIGTSYKCHNLRFDGGEDDLCRDRNGWLDAPNF